MDKQNLYGRARKALVDQGVVLNKTRKSVIAGIVAVMGNEHLDEVSLLRLYVTSVTEQMAKPTKLVNNRTYVPDLGMRQALARAASQPVLISPNSRVRYVHHD
jgi:predicted NAD/FAD-dependent oxidoreductase